MLGGTQVNPGIPPWAQAWGGGGGGEGLTAKRLYPGGKALSISSWIKLLSNIRSLQFQRHLTSILLVGPYHLPLKNYILLLCPIL